MTPRFRYISFLIAWLVLIFLLSVMALQIENLIQVNADAIEDVRRDTCGTWMSQFLVLDIQQLAASREGGQDSEAQKLIDSTIETFLRDFNYRCEEYEYPAGIVK